MLDASSILRERGIQPSAQRVAVAGYVLTTADHPSADVVWKRVREQFPWISRATVYNTLKLFVEKGLLNRLTIAADCVVYDPVVESHHHFIDETTGRIHDVPWDRVSVANLDSLEQYEVSAYEVVMRGRLRTSTTELNESTSQKP
jgi:Fur family transcriptional regulator, iron response regulator